jgi:release factor glutamine methyltransferase
MMAVEHTVEHGPSLRDLYEWGQNELRKAGVRDAEVDAWYLLADAFTVDRVDYYVEPDKPLRAARLSECLPRYEQMIGKRCSRIPLQHILGTAEFMGLPFAVNENVLVPRQDTETLVETVLKERPDPSQRVLDLCTGSGCIAISLAVKGGYDEVTASDISVPALRVAGRNALKLYGAAKGNVGRGGTLLTAPGGRKLSIVASDLTRDLPDGAKYDIITCNPPYIPTSVIRSLDPEVRDHDPRIALDGGSDGLVFYRRLAKELPGRLSRGGSIYLEIGFDEGKTVPAILEKAGFSHIRVVKDIPGLDRVVCADAPEAEDV